MQMWRRKTLSVFLQNTPATDVHYFWTEAERDIWLTNVTSLKRKYIVIEDSLLGLEIILLTIKTPAHLYLLSPQHKYLHCVSRLCTQSRFLKLQTIPSTFFSSSCKKIINCAINCGSISTRGVIMSLALPHAKYIQK